jgi:5'-AMP-activated protein kinase regulatory beta subunit
VTCSHEEFATIIDLPEGVHQYKFIVDDEWRYNPDLPTMPDRSGAVNNFLEVTCQEDAFDIEDLVTQRMPDDVQDIRFAVRWQYNRA